MPPLHARPLRIRLDQSACGGTAAAPTESIFDTVDDNANPQYRSLSHEFVAGPLASGTHTFIVQLRTNSFQSQLQIVKPMLSVMRSKM